MTGLGAARFRPAPYAVVLAIAAAIHLALLAYFIPRRLVFSGSPILGFDFALHAYQVDRALAAMQTTGHLWSYDPVRSRISRARASSCSSFWRRAWV